MGNDFWKRSRLINMNLGFYKLDLKKQDGMITNESLKKKKPYGKIIGITVLAVLIVVLLFGLSVYFPAKELYGSVKKTETVFQQTYTAIKSQDLETSRIKFQELHENIDQIENNLNRLSWLQHFPFLGGYVLDAQHLLAAAKNGVEASQIGIDTLTPYADLLGLKGKSSFVQGSADERIKTAVETLDKIIPNIDQISQKIAAVNSALEQVDENRYPEKVGNTAIRSRFKGAKTLFMQTTSLFVNAQPLLKNIPQLLGIKEAKRYLVLFQNDAELRATGGFITGYALFKIEKGKLQAERSDDIYKLDEAKKKAFPAPSPILKYHKDVNTLNLRDSNLSPDYVVSINGFEKMLKESVPDFPQFDGIIAVDTHVLVSAIKILGEFNIAGRVFSAETDKRCDCPKAIYELEDYSTKPVAYLREDRKGIIGTLLYQIMQRALGVSPGKYWGQLFQMFINEAGEKHVLFYFHDAEAQKGIEAMNFAGRIKDYEGDYLHVNDVNFAGAKSNMFVRQSVKQEINIENDGSIVKTLTISYKNPAPASNCNLEAGQLCLNGILRNWLRIYVPAGSTLIEFTGSEKATDTYEELGKTVFEGFLTVKPQASSEVIVKYRLGQKVNKGEIYKLLIQKQPGTNGNENSVFYGKKQIEKTELLRDLEVTFRM